MAERRMFAKTIIDSDAFLDMPLSTQALYFHLSMRADDDGFINNPKKIQRMIGCSDDDLKLLMAKSFVIWFETGVIVIKHWRMHNCIRKDRCKPTVYVEEMSMLQLKDNGAYTLCQPSDNQVTTICQPSDNQMETQVRLGKGRLGQDRIGEDSIASTTTGSEIVIVIENMMLRHWKRKPTEKDIEIALEYISDNDSVQMLSNALEMSARKGERACNWAYIKAIYESWEKNGIKNELDLVQHEIRRKNGEI